MPSEQTPNQTTSFPNQASKQAAVALATSSTTPQTADILNKFSKGKAAETPMDFLNSITQKTTFPTEKPQSLPEAMEKETSTPAPTPEPENKLKFVPEVKTPEPEQPTPEIPPNQEDPAEEVPVRANFQKLKKTLEETHITLKEKDDALKVAEKKLKEYESGAVMPEVLQTKENKIAELTKYEKLFNLKATPEYDEKVSKPIEKTLAQIGEIADSYKIPKEELLDLLDKPVAEINGYLSEHFDGTGALETKQLINTLSGLKKQAKQMEAEPDAALTSLIKESRHAKEAQDFERKNYIAGQSRSSWEKSLVKIRQENKIKELIFDPHNQEHNTKIAIPVLNQSAQEYGKFVSMIAEHGATGLPDDFFEALSNACLLAHASVVAFKKADGSSQYAKEVETGAELANKYLRPFSKGSANGNQSVPKGAPSISDAAQSLLNQAQSKVAKR